MTVNLKPPHNFTAEQCMLSRMLTSINAANEGVFNLKMEDFYDSRNQAVFQAINNLVRQNLEIDVLSVFHQIEKINPNHKDVSFIMHLINTAGSGGLDETRAFIEDIKKASQLRQLMTLGHDIFKRIGSGLDLVPEEIQSNLLDHLNKVFSTTLNKTAFTPAEVMDNYEDSSLHLMQYIEKQQEDYRQGKSTFKGIPLGYDQLDSMMKGLCKGHFIVVGARPGVGKSSFMCNWIHRLLKFRQQRVGFFSMEMTSHQVIGKLIAIDSGVDYDKIDDGTVTVQEYHEIFRAAKEYEKYQLTIETQDGLPVSQVIARARRMIASQNVSVIFIDYLTRVKGDGKFNSKQEEVQQVSKALCAFAKEANIPLICIAQLNRDMEKSEKVRAPRKSDLSQSGQIEADAHSILLLHRPDQYDKMDRPGLLEVHLVKNRFGKEGMIPFAFVGSTGRYEEIVYRSIKQEIQEAQNDEPWEAFTK